MPTNNGKLIVEDSPDVKYLKQNFENLTQQFDDLEFQMATTSQKDKTDYLLQIAFVQQSLQRLERIYNCLLSTAILTAISLTSGYFWLGSNHNTTPAKVANPTVEITPLPDPESASEQLP